MNSKTYLVTRRGIPMIKITKPKRSEGKSLSQNKRAGAEKAVEELFGVWENKWKDKTTEEVAEMLAEKAWDSHAS